MGLTRRLNDLAKESINELADSVNGDATALREQLSTVGNVVTGALVLLAGAIVVAAAFLALASVARHRS